MPIIGSKSSSTEKFLKNVKPSIALIGVGENNKFGHPNDYVLSSLQNLGIKVYRTDEMGEILIKNNGENIKEVMTCIQ